MCMYVAVLDALIWLCVCLLVVHCVRWASTATALIPGMQPQPQDAKFLKRRVVSGSVDVHPTRAALVVNYQLEAHILDNSGDLMHSDKREFQKIICLSALDVDTDCADLAEEVIEQCSLIHPSKLALVEQLIYYLKNRILDSAGVDNSTMSPGPQPTMPAPMQASIGCVPQYVELLYEDIQDKIKGSALILQLARNPDNLVELSKNEALLSALSRVLREEWKRSIELSTNIVFTFFSFSTYNEFHSVILQYKIGSLCMDVIDYELKRFDQWKDTIEGKGKTGNTPEKSELPKSRIPEPKRRPKSGTWAVSDANIGNRGSRSLNTSFHEDLCNAGDNNKPDEEQLKRKFKALIKRQEQLLRVAFYLLLNIADNIKVEEKMHKKDVVGLLIGALQKHSNIDLSILIVSFLLKLSVYKENKDAMINHGLVDRLPTLLDRASTSPDLVNVTLRLMFNLTFDSKLRSRMVKIGLLPRLISYISDDKHTSIVTKVLYHLSMDDRVKAMFAHTDCVSLVTDMVLVSRGEEGGPLGALAVNLSHNNKCATLMCSAGRLPALVARAFRSTDLMLIKLVRNLSNHVENKHLFVDFVGDIAGAATTQPFVDEAFCIECMGILANILQPELDILAIIKQYNLIPFIMNILDTEHECSEEVVMGVVVMAGSLAAEEAGAAALCAGGGPSRLVTLLRQRQEDDDLVLQLVYAFRQLLRHPSSAAYLINNTEAPAYLIDLMLDKNVEIRKLCEACLDVITQTNSEWADRIKVERFRCHNAQWLSVVETLGSADGSGEGDTEGDLPPYLSPNYLSNHNLFPSGSQTSLAATDESDSLMGDGDADLMRPSTRHARDLEDVDFALMGNSGLLTRSHNSLDSDSIMATEFTLQD